MAIFHSPTIRSGGNAKTVKGDKLGEFATAIMYLAPWKSAGINVCPMAEQAGCIKGCLFTAGRAAVHPTVNQGRLGKTRRYAADRAAFMAELVRDISRFERWCAKRGLKPAVRLNGTSDIQWEVGHQCVRNGNSFASIFEAFPDVRFYDYTKVYKRAYRKLPANYALTLSYSAASQTYAMAIAEAARDTGCNVAIVYRTKEARDVAKRPEVEVMGRRVIDGDYTDMRFLDPAGVIVGLYAKGQARHDTSGFVVG